MKSSRRAEYACYGVEAEGRVLDIRAGGRVPNMRAGSRRPDIAKSHGKDSHGKVAIIKAGSEQIQ